MTSPADGSRDEPVGAWPVVLTALVAVVVIASLARAVAADVAGMAGWVTFGAVTAALTLGVVALPLRLVLHHQQTRAAAATRALQAQHARQEFGAGLARALDMADSVPSVLRVAVRSIAHAAPGASASMLLADSSDAHLHPVVDGDAEPTGRCAVTTPGACPAVRSGHTLTFTSAHIDACPYLAERAVGTGRTLAAVCVPVSIVGRATGVIHAVRAESGFREIDRHRLESVARQAGQRVGMLRATQQARRQATTDPLTGLSNRRRMDEAVHRLVAEGVPFAVAMCDLDRFKRLNDTHGHEMGDRALRLFSRTLRAGVRAGDLVCRYGGEEFVVVLPRADAAGAADVVERVRLELAVAVSDGRVPPFTMSAGVADTSEADDWPALLDLADQRLLAAKRAGRDRVFATSE